MKWKDCVFLLACLAVAATARAQRPRARDLGVPFEGTPGALNAITICYQFKCGTGTASRRVDVQNTSYTVGVLVQANHGRRAELRIAGVPVGAEIPVDAPRPGDDVEQGSIIIVVATDAPLLPHQLERLARRAALGLARTGATSGNGSGDIFVAFSTANAGAASKDVADVRMLANGRMNALFTATVEATEEAIVNALVAAETMTGINGRRVEAVPHDRLRAVMQKYNRAPARR